MEWLKSLVLGVVQGITEFLPISSDGHLLITQNLFDWLMGVTSTRQGEPVLRRDPPPGDDGGDPGLLPSRDRRPGCAGCWATEDVPEGFRRPEVVRVGILAAIATSPLIPLALFFMKWIKRSFEGITVAGIGFLVTAAALLADRLAEPSRRDQGAGRDDVARCPADRPGADARPAAGRQPERDDDRHGPGAGAVAALGRRLQPADRRAGDPGRGRQGGQGHGR